MRSLETTCFFCGEGCWAEPPHRDGCERTAPWASLARAIQRAWACTAERAIGWCRTWWPAVQATGISTAEVVRAGELGRLTRLEERLAATEGGVRHA